MCHVYLHIYAWVRPAENGEHSDYINYMHVHSKEWTYLKKTPNVLLFFFNLF